METELKQTAEIKEDKHGHHHVITIFVEVNGKDKEIHFDHSPVTGAEIRSKAGVPNSDDLTRLVHGKPVGGLRAIDQSRTGRPEAPGSDRTSRTVSGLSTSGYCHVTRTRSRAAEATGIRHPWATARQRSATQEQLEYLDRRPNLDAVLLQYSLVGRRQHHAIYRRSAAEVCPE